MQVHNTHTSMYMWKYTCTYTHPVRQVHFKKICMKCAVHQLINSTFKLTVLSL